MLHPLFSTLIQRPDLVVDHVSAYAALIGQEASAAGLDVVMKIAAWVLVAVSALIFLILAGTAIMLGVLHNQFHWVLIAVPSVVLLLGVSAFVIAKKPFKGEFFPELKAQIENDTRALQMVA